MNSALKLNISRLKVFHEGGKRRILVGELIYDKESDRYEFIYDKKYTQSKKATPVGPGLDLFKLRHISEKGRLFPSFIDRLPDKNNPAYNDYCKMEGISSDEENLIILLGTIGKRGPSSFVYEKVYLDDFVSSDIATLRKKLRITQYDFAKAFDIRPLTLQRIEAGLSHDHNTLKHIEILLKFPDVALWQLKQTGCLVHKDVIDKLYQWLQS